MLSRRWPLSLAMVLLATGCSRHVLLSAPQAGAPPPERLAAYETLRPASLSGKEYAASPGDTLTWERLTLLNGQTIMHPQDLLPVVASDSACADYIAEYSKKRGTANLLNRVGLGAAAVAAGLFLAGYFETFDSSGDYALMGAGLLVGLAGAGAGVVGMIFSGIAAQARNDAFLSYEIGLRKRLGLCLDGSEIVPCGDAPPEPELPPTQLTGVDAFLESLRVAVGPTGMTAEARF